MVCLTKTLNCRMAGWYWFNLEFKIFVCVNAFSISQFSPQKSSTIRHDFRAESRTWNLVIMKQQRPSPHGEFGVDVIKFRMPRTRYVIIKPVLLGCISRCVQCEWNKACPAILYWRVNLTICSISRMYLLHKSITWTNVSLLKICWKCLMAKTFVWSLWALISHVIFSSS
jgi:hypothetical protein